MPESSRHRAGRTLATVCLSGMLDDKLQAAAAAGFDGVELFEDDLIASPRAPREIRQLCADLGLSIDLYQPFRDFEGVPPERFERNLRRAERKFALMEDLGVTTMLVCSTLSPYAIDDDELAAEQLAALAERATKRGIRIAYEALSWGRFVNTWEHSWKIVRLAAHANLGLCLDSFHILSKNPAPQGIATIQPDKLFFVQLADAPRLKMDLVQWSRHHRLFPGQGAFDLARFLDQVLTAGYAGPLSLEVFNDVFRQADPGPAAADAMRSLIGLEEAMAARPARPRQQVCVTAPPPAPQSQGYAFVELAVDGDCGTRVADALTAFGFRRTGQHVSKPVELWSQHDCAILLNHHPTRPGVAALGVQTADPVQAGKRATAFLAPRLPRCRHPAEAELVAVEAPDGTPIFLCGTHDDEPDSWRGDFTAVEAEPVAETPLTRIDHVALTQPFDHVADSTLFYRTMLDLRPGSEEEYAAPFGLIRSSSLANPCGLLRLTMHSAVLRRGPWAPAVGDPTHVAFATDDVFVAARAAITNNAPLLPIPDNYYDDLAARYELDATLLTRMRENNVLYDRDAHGELLHFFTQLLGDSLFFEVVQRVAGYDGYGTANARIRRAAHRHARVARNASPDLTPGES